jgi:hypothetical protein
MMKSSPRNPVSTITHSLPQGPSLDSNSSEELLLPDLALDHLLRERGLATAARTLKAQKLFPLAIRPSASPATASSPRAAVLHSSAEAEANRQKTSLHRRDGARADRASLRSKARASSSCRRCSSDHPFVTCMPESPGARGLPGRIGCELASGLTREIEETDVRCGGGRAQQSHSTTSSRCPAARCPSCRRCGTRGCVRADEQAFLVLRERT